jgi:hypothetical protein
VEVMREPHRPRLGHPKSGHGEAVSGTRKALDNEVGILVDAGAIALFSKPRQRQKEKRIWFQRQANPAL